jgi:hypothetical protein
LTSTFTDTDLNKRSVGPFAEGEDKASGEQPSNSKDY